MEEERSRGEEDRRPLAGLSQTRVTLNRRVNRRPCHKGTSNFVLWPIIGRHKAKVCEPNIESRTKELSLIFGFKDSPKAQTRIPQEREQSQWFSCRWGVNKVTNLSKKWYNVAHKVGIKCCLSILQSQKCSMDSSHLYKWDTKWIHCSVYVMQSPNTTLWTLLT